MYYEALLHPSACRTPHPPIPEEAEKAKRRHEGTNLPNRVCPTVILYCVHTCIICIHRINLTFEFKNLNWLPSVTKSVALHR